MADRTAPSEAQVIEYLDSLSNWGRWGPDDWMGTLNLVTQEKRLKAIQMVREGFHVSCERPLLQPGHPGAHPTPIAAFPPRHFMLATGEGDDPHTGNDFIMLGLHGGQTITHMDAPCHMFHNKTMYNGHPADLVTLRDGAKEGGIELLGQGIVARGVLLDIPRALGKDWLEAGEAIFPEDLDAAEQAQGVRVEEGDVLLVRTGDYRRLLTKGIPDGGGAASSTRPAGAMPGWPVVTWAGLQAACLPWLRERGISLLGCDCPNDVSPSGYSNVPHQLPIHVVGLWSMGLWILDGCNHEDLAAACQQRNRWDFLIVIAPLKLTGATGCPVNPIAIF